MHAPAPQHLTMRYMAGDDGVHGKLTPGKEPRAQTGQGTAGYGRVRQGAARMRASEGWIGDSWSSREVAGERAAASAAEELQRRGSALVCSVCTVDSNADIDAGWRLGRLDLGLNLCFGHMDHDTHVLRVRVRVRVRVSQLYFEQDQAAL